MDRTPIDIADLIQRRKEPLPAGPVELILRSGVSPLNDSRVGVFEDTRTAELCGNALMELDRREHPEYHHFDLIAVNQE